MTIVEQLDALRRGLSGCEAVVYGDIAAGMVLATSAGAGQTQEVFDATLADARKLLGRAGVQAMAAASGGDGERLEVVCANARGVQVYVTGGTGGEEALVCLCEAGVDPGRIMAGARACMDQLEGSS